MLKAFITALMLLAVVTAKPANILSNKALECEEIDEECGEEMMHPLMNINESEKILQGENSTEYWLNSGISYVEYKDATVNNALNNIAKNIVFFVGDGMSLTTLAATRVYLGGEEQFLSFEKFANTGLVKTYALDAMVTDSAASATAYLGGVKANYGTLGVNGGVKRGDCQASSEAAYHVQSIAQWALDAGKSVGIVTNTRVTDATPAGLYAHVADRNWENDAEVLKDCASSADIQDIALQLINGNLGKQLKVVLGGGKSQFLDRNAHAEGKRSDARNLIEEFLAQNNSNIYVETKADLKSIKPEKLNRLLGLFADDHLKYNLQAKAENDQIQPTLQQMLQKALQILSPNPNGYFLFVESGLIDKAHHATQAKLAVDETAELSKAVQYVKTNTKETETLIVVSSDHSHTMSISGYAVRFN